MENEARREELARELAGIHADWLRNAREEAKRDCMESAKAVSKSVCGFCGACIDEARESMKKDRRMPQAVNHVERYEAFRSIQDSSMLLTRIAQTIALAESACEGVSDWDAQEAARDAALQCRDSIAAIAQVTVGAPEATSKGAVEGEHDACELADRRKLSKEIVDTVNAAYASIGDSMRFESFVSDERAKDELYDGLTEAAKEVQKRLDSVFERNARSVEGASIEASDLPSPDFSLACECRFDPQQVLELAKEVRKSFATYGAVLKDNGLFCAFSDGSDFGACRIGLCWWSWWDDDNPLRPGGKGAVKGGGIPTGIPDDDESVPDSLPRTIERMKEFNKRRYMGLLDDDFMVHVDAFWYGFGKLMEFVNGLAVIDFSGFDAYCAGLRDAVASRSETLGFCMDRKQRSAYIRDVRALDRAKA